MKIHIPDYQQARVLIVGDIMLDRYWYGSTSRVSPEAPVPVVHIQQEEDRPGGAGNVALNVAALGCTTTLIGLCGNDAAGTLLESKLRGANINCHLHKFAEIPTITKLRVISQHQQLIRLDFEESAAQKFDFNLLRQTYLNELSNTDVVILSDYAKGILQYAPELIALAQAAGIPILVDPKGSNFDIYRGADLLTPNRKEFEAIVGHCDSEDDIINKGLTLIEQLNLKALLVTRGEQGMTLIQAGEPELHIPAREREVYDVTGAGDTVIAILAASLAAKESLPMCVVLANIGAGITVSKLGAATVSIPELRREVWNEQASGRGIMTEEQLLIAVQDAQAHGERVIMTNGCFDILHAGHVTYLEQAKKLGDRLIVAVNSDDSIRQLKGPERPINSLARRMAVLAGLSAVDWVVSFEDDTPQRLLTQLRPDVLVKGGDYHVDGVVGHEIVHSYGGEVKVLGLVEGCSTTAIIERAKNGYL